MTLLAKTTLFYLFVILLVFGVGGIVTYEMIKEDVRKETDYYLDETFRRLVQAIEEGKPPKAFNNDKVVICELEDRPWVDTMAYYSDTMGLHLLLQRPEPHRKMRKITKINEAYYQISLMDVLIESDDINEGVVDILSQLFIYLSLALILFSFLISRLLLAPFKETLRKIGQFNLKSEAPVDLPHTSTKEFKQLNGFLEGMTDKARQDYLSLKEFNENASHEMQTPIAVAKGKLELLLQEGTLSDKQAGLIQSAHQAIGKLSRIGHSLALLNKIENREFAVVEETDFSEVTERDIVNFRELAELKGLTVKSEIEKGILLPIDASLADILVSNLIKNAIQHNEPGGWIDITLNQKQLLFRNTGKPPKLNTRQLFDRFKKGNHSGGSVGLGLAIVKKICDVNKWQIAYGFKEGVHEIAISFRAASVQSQNLTIVSS